MGKGSNKKWGGEDWLEMASGGDDEHGPIKQSNSNGLGGGRKIESRRRNPDENGNDDGDFEVNNGDDLDPYIEAIREWESHMVAGQKAMKQVQHIYTKQKQTIRDFMETRKQLDEMTNRCKGLRTTILDFEKEKAKEIAGERADIEKKMAEMDEERTILKAAEERAARERKQLEEQKKIHDKRVQTSEAEQKVKLLEQRTKLDKELQEQYRKREEKLESEMKKRQDDDRKRILDLEGKANDFTEKLKEQQNKLKQAEKRYKDVEKLKITYEGEVDVLKENLEKAENEFGLNSGATEFYTGKFVAIHNTIQDISLRNIKELHIGDLDAVHDKLEKADENFSSVPISASEASKKLRVIHAQRVISSQLQEIIWQPLSSEKTLQDPQYANLLSQISEGILKNTHGSSGGQRAARTWMALAMRSLQSQPPPTLLSPNSESSTTSPISRAEAFTEKVMTVLSLLVEPSLHLNLRMDLLDLAASAISVWNIAQTDQREITVNHALNPANLEGWHEGMSAADSKVIVLFPSITARSYSRIADNRLIGLPGAFDDFEPEPHIQETCIHDGVGLGKWSRVVLEGEEEEDERRENEEIKKVEEKKRKLKEEMEVLDKEKLEKPGTGHARRTSLNRRESIPRPGPSPSSPSAVWLKRSGQKIIEGE